MVEPITRRNSALLVSVPPALPAVLEPPVLAEPHALEEASPPPQADSPMSIAAARAIAAYFFIFILNVPPDKIIFENRTGTHAITSLCSCILFSSEATSVRAVCPVPHFPHKKLAVRPAILFRPSVCHRRGGGGRTVFSTLYTKAVYLKIQYVCPSVKTFLGNFLFSYIFMLCILFWNLSACPSLRHQNYFFISFLTIIDGPTIMASLYTEYKVSIPTLSHF